jgi:hypothetical protein
MEHGDGFGCGCLRFRSEDLCGVSSRDQCHQAADAKRCRQDEEQKQLSPSGFRRLTQIQI